MCLYLSLDCEFLEKKNVTLLIFSPHSLAECLAHSNNSINIHWNEKTFNGPQFTLSIIWTLLVRIYSFLNIREDTMNCFPELSRTTAGYLLSPNFPLHHQPFRVPVVDSILDFISSIYSPRLFWSSFLRPENWPWLYSSIKHLPKNTYYPMHFLALWLQGDKASALEELIFSQGKRFVKKWL